jgi:hypothetical protein
VLAERGNPLHASGAIETEGRQVSGNWNRGPRWGVLAIGLLCGVFASSCSRAKIPEAKGTRLTLYPVKGSVEMNGKPLAGALLKFYPLRKFPEDASQILPQAWTQSDGTFTVSTYGDGDGAPKGKYRVIVRCQGPGLVRIDDPDLIPPPYNNPKMTKLIATVEEGENTLPPINLELTPEQAAKLTAQENPDESQAGS